MGFGFDENEEDAGLRLSEEAKELRREAFLAARRDHLASLARIATREFNWVRRRLVMMWQAKQVPVAVVLPPHRNVSHLIRALVSTEVHLFHEIITFL